MFLFACREPDVELTLNRLFTTPLTQLFASEAIDCSDAGIRAMTEHLQESARKGSPDHSALLDSSVRRPSSLRPVAMAPPPIALALAPSAATRPVHTSAPTDPVEPLTAPLFRSPTGPSVQPRPIARRAAPPPAHRSKA